MSGHDPPLTNDERNAQQVVVGQPPISFSISALALFNCGGATTLPRLKTSTMNREALITFIRGMHDDLLASQRAEAVSPSSPYERQAGGWENPDLPSFLDAMASWIEDMGDRLPSSPNWETFQDILSAAKIYE